MRNMQKKNAKMCKICKKYAKNKDPICKTSKKYARKKAQNMPKICSLCRVYILHIHANYAPGTLDFADDRSAILNFEAGQSRDGATTTE